MSGELPFCNPFSRDARRVNDSKVTVRASEFGDGAFARCDIRKGECVEWGVVRRLVVVGCCVEYSMGCAHFTAQWSRRGYGGFPSYP